MCRPFAHRISEDDSKLFIQLSGDKNRIHQGDGAIVHGSHIISLISGDVWKTFGDGTVVTEIGNTKFFRPIKLGEVFTVTIYQPEPTSSSHRPNLFQLKVVVSSYVGGRSKTAVHAVVLLKLPTEAGEDRSGELSIAATA